VIRDKLEAALFRPQTGYYADLIEEAAALWESLSQKSPVHRLATSAPPSLPRIPFWPSTAGGLTADAEATYQFMIELYESQRFNFEALSNWLRQNAKPAV